MEFCPTCANMLQFEQAQIGRKSRFFCPTCPYICTVERKITKRQHLVKKEVESVFSGEEAMKFAPKTDAICPRCNFGKATFRQMQIRSADEPMTTFYQCCNDSCRHNWREE